MEVARVAAQSFGDGVAFVALGAITDPTLVAPTIGQALALTEQGGQAIEVVLRRYVQDKHLLLVLDNFEQVLAAAAVVADVLAAAPQVKVLVTSRAPLHLTGEQECPILPLPLPDLERLPSPEVMLQIPAVDLFMQRVQAVRPDVQLTAANAQTVAAIVVRLDGLPLAIELVARRVKVLDFESLLTRLQDRLLVLTGGARDLPARQQTLRATIAWSVGLLEPHNQLLFARLAVFAGSWRLHAAEAVCSVTDDPDCDLLDGLQALVDANMVRSPDVGADEPRFAMFETIREYARELLKTSGEAEVLRRRHAAYYVAVAETAECALEGRRQAVWLKQLEAEHANLRAALRWLLDITDVETMARLGGALSAFWLMRGHISEGRYWLGAALGTSHPLSPVVRAKALRELGMLMRFLNNYADAQQLLEESLHVFRTCGTQRDLGMVHLRLGDNALGLSDDTRAKALGVSAFRCTSWEE